ncbi:hypothetical protein ABDI30_11880 [Paenibacillus cisolokensis]|uniref:hypothetical protein n=1 Tax=Paenibacillus cisolokensis TaxID=1658519 RepID=UPI003D2AA8F3
MKAVPKVNTDGLYIEDALVDDAFNGVVPFYAEPPVPDPALPDPDDEQPEPEIAGYIVGVPVPPGLYLPRFDLVAWEAFQEEEEPGEQPAFWVEGLTPEQIEEITTPQQSITPERVLAAEVVRRELDVLNLEKQNAALGVQVVEQDLTIKTLKTQYEALGKSVVTMELRLLELLSKGGGDVGV